ncbi:retrovirus-related pol polyprotein from transposon TNT 1-94 [Tanacetum coccineum]
MTLEVHNWSSSVHKEVHKIISHEIAPIINQVDARVQNFEIQFLKEATKFVRDFKSLAKEAGESLDKQKYLELEIERLLKASVSHDIMSIVQNSFVDVPSNLQTELDQCKYDKISYDKAYKDMQCQIERLQAQLGDLKGKRSITPSASNTLDPLNQKLETKIVELELQVVNFEREIRHLKTTYKNLFDYITSNRENAKLHNLIYENTKLRARVFKKTFESINNTSGTSVTPQVDKPKLSAVTHFPKKLHASIPSHSVPQPKEFNVVKHSNVIAPGMFKIDPSQTSRVDLVPNNQSSASIRTNPITNSQHHVTFKENVSSDTVNSSSTGLVHTARTRRPQPKGNTRNDRVPSASKSSKAKKNVIVEDHRRNLSLSKNQKTMSSECNNIKLAIRNDKSEIVCGTCKQCFVTANHDACLLSLVNALNSRANNLCAKVPPSANQKRHRTQVWKPKQVGSKERLATPKPRLPRFSLKWSPTGSSFDLKGKLVASNETNCPNDDNACPSNPQEPIRKRFPNSTVFLGRLSKFFLGTVRFGNDHIAAILGYGDLKWGNITIARVYFVEGFVCLDFINNVKLRANSRSVKKIQREKLWKTTKRCFTNIRYIWRPTGRTFTIVGNTCPLTRITTTTEVPLRKSSALDNKTPKPVVTLVYSRKPRKSKTSVPVNNYTVIKSVVQIVLWYLDSGCSKHMTRDRSQLTNFVSKFLGTVKFGNDHVAKIMGYGDYQIGNVTILRVYYVEGLGHNLFSVGQFCDSNLEVAFRQHTCYIRNLKGVDLLTGSQGDNLYTLSLGDMMASSPICLLSKESKTKSWLWHRRLSYLNFGAINHLARHGLVRVRLKETVRRIRTDNGTEFVNQTLREYYEKVGISHETSVARSPQQNGVVEIQNHTLIEASLFLWAEAVATACYTQNRSMILRRHGKTPYEFLHNKPPDLS